MSRCKPNTTVSSVRNHGLLGESNPSCKIEKPATAAGINSFSCLTDDDAQSESQASVDDVSNPPDAYEIAVHRYRLKPPLDWARDCDDEMYRMTKFWNALVEIERSHRAAVTALTANDPVVAELHGQYDEISTRIDALRAENKKHPDIAALRTERKALAGMLKPARKVSRDKQKASLSALETQRRAAVKHARQTSELYWGGYNAVAASYERARSRAMKTGTELHFRRHNGEGRIVNQIQGGITTTQMYSGSHSMCRIMGRERHAQFTCTIFTGRDETGRTRRSVTWPMVQDRPLPDDALVQEVSVSRRRRGPQWEWHVSFLMRVEPRVRALPGPASCAIDVGWRKVDGGVRAAMLVDSVGRREALIVPEYLAAKLRRAAEIRSERDKSGVAMSAMLKQRPWHSAAPELQAVAARLKAPVLKPETLHPIVYVWRQYPEWEPEHFAVGNQWLRCDKKAWDEETGLRRRVSAARQDIFRCFAARLVRNYGIIGVEKIDLAAMRRKTTPDGADNAIAYTNWYANLASPGELLAVIANAAKREGVPLYRHDGPSTWRCHRCGVTQEPARPEELYQSCPACGTAWDQDVNAARNILAAALASAPVPSESPGPLAWENSGAAIGLGAAK